MNCEEVREILAAFVGGELSEAERASAEGHLAVCAACSRELDGYREARAELAALREETPPPGSWKALWSGVRMELFPRPPSRALIFMDHAIRYAAVLLVGVVLGAMSYLVAVPEVPGMSDPVAAPGPSPIEVVPAPGGVRSPVVPVGTRPGLRFRIVVPPPANPGEKNRGQR